ncbi:hypothetical protein JCM10213v2_005661 [Rhodosporidiobolus nylandii]
MYPRFTRGFTARVAVLLVLLAAIILVSLLYLCVVTIRDTRRKGRSIWFARIVQRPTGRYFALNQHGSYPLFSIILAAIWIAYVAYIYEMFGPAQGNPRSLFYWLTLGWLPFFALLSTTTFAVTSSANLASSGKQPGSHRLGPRASAAIFILLVPVLLGVVLGTGIWTGYRWHTFASSWQRAFDFLGRQAAEYSGTLDEQTVQQATELLETRCSHIQPFRRSQLVTSIIYIVAALVLVLLNLFSALYLLSTLSTLRQIDDRQLVVPRDMPLVAPLQPIPQSTEATTLATVTDAGQPAEWESEAQTAKLKLHRLRWDVVLFFMSVVPSCLAFIGYTAWMNNRLIYTLYSAPAFEFADLGMIWIFAAISLACLSALTIRSLLSLRAAKRRPREPAALMANTPKANLQKTEERTRQTWREEQDDEAEISFDEKLSQRSPRPSVAGDLAALPRGNGVL